MHTRTSGKKGKIIGWTVAGVVLLAALVYFLSGTLGRTQYPLRYTESIRESAERFGLDPYRVAAVIRTESGFDPEAVSRAGAMGLMQIMPETGQWIAEKLDVADFAPVMLLDPARNIEFGCWYLQFLKERFGGDPELISAAYNAGHNRVARWLQDPDVSQDGLHLHAIPYPETRDYVQKIAAAYDRYRSLYPDAFQ